MERRENHGAFLLTMALISFLLCFTVVVAVVDSFQRVTPNNNLPPQVVADHWQYLADVEDYRTDRACED